MSADQPTFCLGTACNASVGDQACIDVTANGFTDVVTFQMDISYPAENLSFDMATTGSALSIPVDVNELNDSTVRLVFFDQAQAGVTVADDATLVTICFDVAQGGATVLDANGLVVATTAGTVVGTANDGSINGPGCDGGTPTCNDGVQNGDETGVDCGGSCAPCAAMACGEGTDAVSFCVGTECADVGAEVCLPIFIGNFTSLGGFQFSLEYAAANLQYTRFTAANSDLMDGTTVASPADGQVNFVFNDITGTGLSFGNDAPAYELCFTVESAAPSRPYTGPPSWTWNPLRPVQRVSELWPRSSGVPSRRTRAR